jgi:hypothetical protein
VAVRARIVGWNTPSVAELGLGGGRPVPQGVLPSEQNPQSLNIELRDRARASGEDYFGFDVHTPETLQGLLVRRVAVFGRGMVVVVDAYEPDRVVEMVRPIVEAVEASTWEELAFRVGSLAPWEFEGWKWHPDEERLRQDRGVEAEVRDVRLLRTAIGDAFSLPIEVRFGGTGVPDDVVVPMVLQSPLWIRGKASPGDVELGAGRIFALEPNADAIRSALADDEPIARAPSWDLLRLTLTPTPSLGT